MKLLRNALVAVLLGILGSNVACAIAAEPDCDKIAKMNANELLALWEMGFIARSSPEVKCSSEAPALDPGVCNRDLTILEDRVFACDRRLLLTRVSGHDSVHVFGTVDGQVKQLLDPGSTSLGTGREIKVEQATTERLVFIDPKTAAAKNVLVWDTKLQRYKGEGSDETKTFKTWLHEHPEDQIKRSDYFCKRIRAWNRMLFRG